MTDVRAWADQLRQYAEHFQQTDWNYTRDTGRLEAIRYNEPFDALPERIKRAVRWLFERDAVLGPRGLRERIQFARYALERDKHMPDGVLDNGNIITHWEETGEYLQYVQPSVGSLIADWMDAEPDNPHAIRVAQEMKRINDAYGKRLAAEKDAA